MPELEVKVLSVEPEALRERLKQLGAALMAREKQVNYLYDYPDGRLKSQGGYVRLRRVKDLLGERVYYLLTWKRMISQQGCKEMEELETEVEDREVMDGILRRLGLEQRRCDEKYRESYALGEIKYELDIWAEEVYPHPYLEVEGPDQKSIEEALELIGYTISEATTRTIAQLREELLRD